MFKKHYYCFISGLPDLSFEEGKLKSTLLEFKQELEIELGHADYKLVSLLFLPVDHENLINHLLKEGKEHNPLGNFTASDFEELEPHPGIKASQKHILPGYMVRFIRDFHDDREEKMEEDFEKILAEGYYDHVLKAGNPFLCKWFEFELNAKNILTAFICSRHNIDTEGELVGRNQLAEDLMNTRKKHPEISIEDDYLNEVMQLSEIDDFLKREKRFDLLKWDYLDEHTFFYYFTIERIFAYLIKFFIVFRWINIQGETGREMFEKLIHDLNSSYELPLEFCLKK